MTTLNTLIDRAAQEGGGKIALIYGEREISFLSLRHEVLAVAEGLRRSGLAKGDRVAIVHRNAPEFVIAYFALNRLGAIAVPINFMVQKATELAYMLNDCGAVAAVTQTDFLPGLTGAAPHCPALKTIWVSDLALPPSGLISAFAALRAPVFAHTPVDPAAEEDIAAILYTSGTTGHPKGVMLTHRNLCTNCEASLKHMNLNR